MTCHNNVAEYNDDDMFTCSEIPHELRREARGGEVDINIEDRRNEDFVQKKPKLVPFSGAGQKLGK